MAFKILIDSLVISFAAITSGPVIQIGCFEVRKFHAIVGSESARWPNLALIGTIASLGSTSANQRSAFQNFGRKQSSKLARSTNSRAPLVKSGNSKLSAHNSSRQ